MAHRRCYGKKPGLALEEGTGKLSSRSTPAGDGMDLLNPEGRALRSGIEDQGEWD